MSIQSVMQMDDMTTSTDTDLENKLVTESVK